MTAKKKKKDAPPRRVPTQARSRNRYDAILDAAAEVFAVTVLEAATMEAVAARAETSIGSVYQFFPNKQALFQAVAERCLARAQRLFEALLSPDVEGRSWVELLEASIDGFATLHDADPGFRAMVLNQQLYGAYAEADAAQNQGFIERAQQLLGVIAPRMPLTQRKLVATMIVQVTSAILLVSVREQPSFAQQMRGEVKQMLRLYVEAHMSSGS